MTDLTLPDAIRHEIDGYDHWQLVRHRAPSRVAMLAAPARPPLVLKIGKDLQAEADRIRWLQGKLPVPEVVAIASHGSLDYLLTTRLPGIDGTIAHERLGGVPFIQHLANALRTIHRLPTDNCPFAASVTDLLAVAEERVSRGDLRSEHFPARYLGRTPDDLLEILRSTRPDDAAAVVIHGDPSLPNFLFQEDGVSGIIDLGLVGVSDPYWDLAVVARSITRNMGGRWVRPFFAAYGAPLDERRIEFFALLDEFIMARLDTASSTH